MFLTLLVLFIVCGRTSLGDFPLTLPWVLDFRDPGMHTGFTLCSSETGKQSAVDVALPSPRARWQSWCGYHPLSLGQHPQQRLLERKCDSQELHLQLPETKCLWEKVRKVLKQVCSATFLGQDHRQTSIPRFQSRLQSSARIAFS